MNGVGSVRNNLMDVSDAFAWTISNLVLDFVSVLDNLLYCQATFAHLNDAAGAIMFQAPHKKPPKCPGFEYQKSKPPPRITKLPNGLS